VASIHSVSRASPVENVIRLPLPTRRNSMLTSTKEEFHGLAGGKSSKHANPVV
jgi:hypothetical protein